MPDRRLLRNENTLERKGPRTESSGALFLQIVHIRVVFHQQTVCVEAAEIPSDGIAQFMVYPRKVFLEFNRFAFQGRMVKALDDRERF